MYSKTKRILAVALASLMAASALAGCDGGSTGSTASGSGNSGDVSSDTQEVKSISVDEMMKDAQLALGDEGKDSEVKLKVWAPQEAADVFEDQCAEFVKNFKDQGRKISIEVVAQGESDAGTQLMNDPEQSADVFGFVSDHASKLYPGTYTSVVRANFQQNLKDQNLEGAIDAASYKDPNTNETNMYAYPETGDNSYVLFYDKSVISEEEVKSMESIMKVCNEKNKTFIMDADNGFYSCMIPLTAGGKYSVGTDDEGLPKQELQYDEDAVVKVAKAWADLVGNDKHFVNNDPDTSLPAAFQNGKAACGIAGSWKIKALQKVLGDNYAAVKLPTLKVDGKDTQLVNMFGYKLIGVNSKTKYQLTSQALAYYLTSEQCQKERLDKLEWGPSIKTLIESDTVKNSIGLSAIFEQQKYSVAQAGLTGAFWDPTGAFGLYLVTPGNDFSEEAIKKEYEKMVTNITTT